MIASLGETPGVKTIAITDEISLKGTFPFVGTFIRGLGLNLRFATCADHSVLRCGVNEANLAYCAPMQLYHGLMSQIADDPVDCIFLSMVRGLDHVGIEPHAKVWPIVQACTCILRQDLAASLRARNASLPA